MTNTTAPSAAASLGLLVLRVVVGAVFAAHGAQKIFENTIPGTIEGFAGMGVPLAEIAGPEFVAVLGAAALALVFTGAGRASLDHLLFRRRAPRWLA